MVSWTRVSLRTQGGAFQRLDSVVSSGDSGVDFVFRARSQYPVLATSASPPNATSLYTEGAL